MPLDLAVLSRNGEPERSVALGVAAHAALVAAAADGALHALLQFSDYYADARVATEDLPVLIEQIDLLLGEEQTEELRKFLLEFRDLVDYAICRRVEVHAIAD